MAGRGKVLEMGNVIPAEIKVLLVDDNPVCLSIMTTRLKSHGYHVTTCLSGVEALAKLQAYKGKFDMVLMDLQNHTMDGLTLLQKINEEEDVAVIVITTCEDRKSVMKAVLNGACDYLVKPPDDKSLKFLWQHVLRKAMTKEIQEFKLACGDHGVDTGAQAVAAPSMQQINDGTGATVGARDRDANSSLYAADVPTNVPRIKSSRPPKPQTIWKGEYRRKFLQVLEEEGSERRFAKRLYGKLKRSFHGITKEQVSSQLHNYRLEQKALKMKNKQQGISSKNDGLATLPSQACNPPPSNMIHSSNNDAALNPDAMPPIFSPSHTQLMGLAKAAAELSQLENLNKTQQMNLLLHPQVSFPLRDMNYAACSQQPALHQNLWQFPSAPGSLPNYDYTNLEPVNNNLFHDNVIHGNNNILSTEPMGKTILPIVGNMAGDMNYNQSIYQPSSTSSSTTLPEDTNPTSKDVNTPVYKYPSFMNFT